MYGGGIFFLSWQRVYGSEVKRWTYNPEIRARLSVPEEFFFYWHVKKCFEERDIDEGEFPMQRRVHIR